MTNTERFTVHRANGWNVVVGVFAFLICVETAGLHLVLATWVSPAIAWVATALSASSLVWLLRDAQALARGGVFVRANEVELRIGRRWHAYVLRDAITGVDTRPDDDAADLSILGANVVLRLRRPVRLHGMLGRTRDATAIALSLDDRDAFVRALDQPRNSAAAIAGSPVRTVQSGM